jgi:hypothetical protein
MSSTRSFQRAASTWTATRMNSSFLPGGKVAWTSAWRAGAAWRSAWFTACRAAVGSMQDQMHPLAQGLHAALEAGVPLHGRQVQVALEEVEVGWIVADNAAAGFYWQTNQIRIEPSSLGDISGIITHELCHAWDSGHDFPSLDHPSLFHYSHVPLQPLYPTEDERTVESFARHCEDHPDKTAFQEGMAHACGLELAHQRTTWLRENVWRHHQPGWLYAGPIEVERTTACVIC